MKDFEPVGEVLSPLTIIPLGDGMMPIDAIVLVKAMDSDGRIGWYHRMTEGVTGTEAVGALVVATDIHRNAVRDNFRPIGEDE